MGELFEIIKFSREVTADLNLYCKNYLTSPKSQKVKYNSIFWGKVRDIIIDAK